MLALVEAAGELFYQSLARSARTDEARKLLTRTSQEERGHARRIVKALQILGGGDDRHLAGRERTIHLAQEHSRVKFL